MVRHLLGRRSEAAFLAEVAGDWSHLFPCLPHQSEANRRTPLAAGRIRADPDSAGSAPAEDDCQQVGRDAAHAEWFYGFRLAIRTDLGSRLVRAWGIVPAAVSERDVGNDLLQTGPPPRDLLIDKGFNGKAFTAGQAARGTAVLPPPARPSANPACPSSSTSTSATAPPDASPKAVSARQP